MLGTIYSSQFKCQHDCSFSNADEIVRFLFLMHNQNTRVQEELLKTMKPTDSLHDALKIARLAEGTIHSEELSKQYLDSEEEYTDQQHTSQQVQMKQE